MSESTTPPSPSSLDDAVNKLLGICEVTKQSPTEATKVFLAALVLLNELKGDQATLQRIRVEKGVDAVCPPPNEIPAITAVVQNAALLRSLFRCLLSATGEACDQHDPGHHHHHHNVHHVLAAGRKRSLSMVGDNERATNKMQKITQSPVPNARNKINLQMQMQDSSGKKPSFNVPVVCATILYMAFQHLDHWPEQLVRAYAEDCFGPRLWVDDKRCSLLVENLALAHDETAESPKKTTNQMEKDAAIVAESFRKFDSTFVTAVNGNAKEESPIKRRGSLDSSSSRGKPNARIRRQLSSMSDDSLGSGRKSGTRSEQSDICDVPETGQSNNGEKDGSLSLSADEHETGDDLLGHQQSNGEKAENAKLAKSKEYSPDPNERTPTADNDVIYPVTQRQLNLARVRQRFFGVNLQNARRTIASSLSGRLDLKSKQNSGLLQSLPSFTSIPSVRRMIAQNLEKWLQSPALAGLARNLFSSTVNHMKNVDPPLKEDLRTIDSILAMRLKANQLNAHIENVTAIAKRIPVGSVAHHMYSKLLKEVMTVIHTDSTSNISELKMIGAIHKEFDSHISYDAMAATMLNFLVSPEPNSAEAEKDPRNERLQLVKKLQFVIRAISSELGPAFDGCQFVEAFLSLDTTSAAWSIQDEEDKARLMFQCAILTVDLAKKKSEDAVAASDEKRVRETLKDTRNLFLTWCCSDFGPRYTDSSKKSRSSSSSSSSSNDIIGAGLPDFSSALGPAEEEEKIPSWLNTMRCLLFLEEPDSPLMKRFVVPDGKVPDIEWELEVSRIKLCCAYGGDLTDDMIWIILKSASQTEGGIDSDMAICLLEHLFENCSKLQSGSLRVSDPNIVWELYNLVLYHPSKPLSLSEENSDDTDNTDSGVDVMGAALKDIPRLSYPGLWWRVTMLALILCGVSPKEIGNIVWNDHPTLRSLMKMVTSNRYRFPTVDCDEEMRICMKQDEQSARELESKTAEYLFLPKKRPKNRKEKKGSRISRRLLKQQQEKEAAKELAETNRRKKLLKAAQKTIMLWDPDGPARKPPRESVDLLLSVEELFGLSEIFQKTAEPDFLLKTIGQTTRGAIERAYEWLIPIISTLPETIARLPSSASCFLLLRAYGTEGDERKQLKELSSPLLLHVKYSLNGKYGESDSVKAFDLLMSDVASHKPDRRRCARRVLQDAFQSADMESYTQSWMLNILEVKFAQALVSDAVKHMSTAAAFERGYVLRSLLLALEQHFVFASKNDVEMDVGFPERLIQVISSRPGVCAEAMDAFSDLWCMVVKVTHSEFSRCLKDGSSHSDSQSDQLVIMQISSPDHDGPVKLSLPLLLSMCVVLSVWKCDDDKIQEETTNFVESVADALLRPADGDCREGDDMGLSGARLVEDDSAVITVELWIMLAKARSDVIARRAALSAPSHFLPRLLLCSGLPRASLLTMIDRLGRLGESVADRERTYLELLTPKASSEWDIGRVGQRHEMFRKLLGRLSAYLRLNKVSLSVGSAEVSQTFVLWLAEECRKYEEKKTKKSKSKKAKAAKTSSLSKLTSASSIVTAFHGSKATQDFGRGTVDEEHSMEDFIPCENSATSQSDSFGIENAQSILDKLVENRNYFELDKWLGVLFMSSEHRSLKNGSEHEIDFSILSSLLLQKCTCQEDRSEGLFSAVLKWVPCLCQHEGKPQLWKYIFRFETESSSAAMWTLLLSKCLSSWSREHCAECREWIISESDKSPADFDFVRIATFLVSTSEQSSAQIENYSSITPTSKAFEFGVSKDFVASSASIAIRALKQGEQSRIEAEICSQDSLPPGFLLMLLLARCGKNQLQVVSELLLYEMTASEDDVFRSVFEVILLRLYLLYPFWMDLGSSVVRTALMHASENHASSWTGWKSSMDDRLKDMLDTLLSGDFRISRSLADLSRKHPLLLLRLLSSITAALRIEAKQKTADDSDSRGIVVGQHLQGSCEAIMDGKNVKVSLKHWGYSFNEPLWTTVLDIISAVHREVLFNSGPKVGLLRFLGVYLELMSVQLQLMSAGKVQRLKAKLAECFKFFQETNGSGWREWLGTKIGESEVRHLLMSCDFITPQEAIESLRSK